MTNKAFRGLFLCAVLGALLFRVVRLDVRPMHHDEANQAVKFGALLERGEYRFDPGDHHGPSLYYFTLPAARDPGARAPAKPSETTPRRGPGPFGAGAPRPRRLGWSDVPYEGDERHPLRRCDSGARAGAPQGRAARPPGKGRRG